MTSEMTPDDVREAARTALDERQDYAEQHGHPTFQDEPSAYLNGFEDGVAFEVRPRGAVTDAFAEYINHLGVDSNEDHNGEWWDGYRQAQRDTIRKATAALDAAREARQ